MDIPQNYTSPDVIDRRNGQAPTMADRVRDLIIKVRDDYQSSIGKNPNVAPMPGLDDAAVQRIHAKMKTMFGEDDQ